MNTCPTVKKLDSPVQIRYWKNPDDKHMTTLDMAREGYYLATTYGGLNGMGTVAQAGLFRKADCAKG